ncbi:MAG: VOC family protein [Kofleriaceae bacterium]|nr:VOC family protein [Kofleriaceae bacterium]
MKLGYVIVYVPDVLESVSFYERAFGLQRRFIHESGQYAELETGSTALAFANEESVALAFERNRPTKNAAGVEIALVSEHVQNDYTKAIAAGASAVSPPEEKPWGQTVCYVRDLNGVLVEICSAVQQ